MHFFRKLFIMPVLMGLLACGGHQEVASVNHSEVASTTLAENLPVRRYKDIYFSGQPTEAQLSALKSQGFAAVINLRTVEESDQANQQSLVESMGLAFVRVPVTGDAPLSVARMDKITQAILAHRGDGKILVHCSSANRVGWWAGVHFFKDHHLSAEQSMQIAEQIGLTNKTFKEQLSDWYEEREPAAY